MSVHSLFLFHVTPYVTTELTPSITRTPFFGRPRKQTYEGTNKKLPKNKQRKRLITGLKPQIMRK